MKTFLHLLLVCIVLSGCYAKRLLPEQPPEQTARRISPESFPADGRIVAERFEGFIRQVQAALKASYPRVSFSATAWYQFPKDDPNGTRYYAVFDIVGVPSGGAELSVIESAILNDWQNFSKAIKAATGDDADFSYAVPLNKKEGFSMAFLIKKKRG